MYLKKLDDFMKLSLPQIILKIKNIEIITHQIKNKYLLGFYINLFISLMRSKLLYHIVYCYETVINEKN